MYYLEQNDTKDQAPVTRSEKIDVVLVPELEWLDPYSDLGDVDVVFMVLDICLNDLRGQELWMRLESDAVSYQADDEDGVNIQQRRKSSEPM